MEAPPTKMGGWQRRGGTDWSQEVRWVLDKRRFLLPGVSDSD